MKRKNILLVLIISLICSLTALVGCGGNEGPKGPTVSDEPATPSIYITNKNDFSSLIVGDVSMIYVSTNDITGYNVEYSSTNANVVKIDSKGLIEGVSEGTASIVATYTNGDKTAQDSVEVNVSFGNIVPELKFGIPVNDGCSIQLNDELSLNPYVMFNGKKYTDITFEATSSDDTKVDVDNKGVLTGINYTDKLNPTTITLTASWRGYKHPSLTTSFVVEVSPRITIINSDGYALTDIVLSTLPEFDGIAYKNKSNFNLKFYENGYEFNPSNLTCVFDDEEIVKKVGDELVANKFGETKLTVSFTTDTNFTYVTSVNVIVSRPKKVFTDTIEYFSIFDGTFVDSGLNDRTLADVIGTDVMLIDAYLDGVQLPNPVDNRIRGIEFYDNVLTNSNITVGTREALYEFNCDLYQACINDASDLDVFKHANGRVVYGNIIMLKDIDASSYNVDHNFVDGDTVMKFNGIFDGMGHTISNLTLESGEALIPFMGATGVIKNVAFYNTHSYNSKIIAWNNENSSIVNMADIYIHYASDSYLPLGFKGHASSAAKNIVIDYSGEIDYFNYDDDGNINGTKFYPGSYPVLSSGDSRYCRLGILGSFGSPDSYAISYQSVVVFNPNNYVLFGSNAWGELTYDKSTYYYAYNAKYAADGKTATTFTPVYNDNNKITHYTADNHAWTDAKYVLMPGVRSYASPAEMEQSFLNGDNVSTSHYDYNSFAGKDCWIVVNGTPYWKGTYALVNATLNGENVDGAIALTTKNDVVSLSLNNGNENYKLASGAELQNGEYSVVCKNSNVVLTTKGNAVELKLAGVIAENQVAEVVFTAKDEKVGTISKTVYVNLVKSGVKDVCVLDGVLTETPISLGSDINKLDVSLKSIYDGSFFTIGTAGSLNNGEYVLTTESEHLKLVANDDGTYTITLAKAVDMLKKADLIFTAKEGGNIVEYVKSIELTNYGVLNAPNRIKLDTTSGEIFFDNKVLENVSVVNYIDEEGNAYPITVENSKVVGVKSSVLGNDYTIAALSKQLSIEIPGMENPILINASRGFNSNFGVVKFQVVSNGFNYYFNRVEVATRIIDQASDLEVFNLTGEGDFNDGYYIMINNVDATSFVSSHDSSINFASDIKNNVGKYGFGGVFDGKGYTIKNLTLPHFNGNEEDLTERTTWYVGNGLFGRMYGSFIVKNVALDNVNSNFSALFANTYHAYTKFNGVADYYTTAQFANIYVKYSDSVKYPFGFIAYEYVQTPYGPCYQNILVEQPAGQGQYNGMYSQGIVGNSNIEIYLGAKFKLITDLPKFNAQEKARIPEEFTAEVFTNVNRYYKDLIAITNGYVAWPNLASWNGVNATDVYLAYNEQTYVDGKSLAYYVSPITKKIVYLFKDGDNQSDFFGAPATVFYKDGTSEIDYEKTYAVANTNCTNAAGYKTDEGVKLVMMQKFNSTELLVESGRSFDTFDTAYWNITSTNGPVWKTLF